MGDEDLKKAAASALRELKRENVELLGKIASYDRAEELVHRMIEMGAISSENAMEKYADFKEKLPEELEVTEKALELTKEGEFQTTFSIGSLSSELDENTPEDKFYNFLTS